MLSKLEKLCFTIFDEFRAALLVLMKKYISGDTTTGGIGDLRKYINKTTSNTISATRTDLMDVKQYAIPDGNLRVFSKSGTSLTVAAECTVLSLYAIGSGAVPAISEGGLTADEVAYVIDPATGNTISYNATYHLKTAWSPGSTTISFTNSPSQVGAVYIQPSSITSVAAVI